LVKNKIHIDTPLFNEDKNTTYEKWLPIYKNIDFSKYDTIICHSL
jgi:hypothetical protein